MLACYEPLASLDGDGDGLPSHAHLIGVSILMLAELDNAQTDGLDHECKITNDMLGSLRPFCGSGGRGACLADVCCWTTTRRLGCCVDGPGDIAVLAR